MPSIDDVLSPFRRDVLLAVLAVALLAAPLWVGVIPLEEPTHTYERVEVSTDQGDVWYDEDDSVLRREAISDEIACSGGGDPAVDDVRRCAFERDFLEDGESESIHAGVNTSNPEAPSLSFRSGTEPYVWIDGALYETTFEAGDENDDGLHPMYLDLSEADPDDVFADVSLDAEADRDRIPSVVLETIEDGKAESEGAVDVPETTIEDDGTYYRVIESGRSAPSDSARGQADLARYAGPVVGVLLLARVSRRIDIEIMYTGENDR